jgi:predicted dehydrogenase
MGGVTVAVVGAGSRGTRYARWVAAHPDRARVVAVAEPRADRRRLFAEEHGLDPGAVHADWRELAGRGRVADAVVIATPDGDHVESAEAFAALGHHLLLEKADRAYRGGLSAGGRRGAAPRSAAGG